jgi:hypothetical protein
MEPAMQDPRELILRRTEAFAAELTDLIKKIALDAVSEALAGAVSLPAVKRGGPRPAARTEARPAKAAAAAKAPRARARAERRAPGQKRPAGELAKATEELGAHIRANPGSTMESIGKALGHPRADLALPIKKLVAAESIRFEGVKRARRYFPA